MNQIELKESNFKDSTELELNILVLIGLRVVLKLQWNPLHPRTPPPEASWFFAEVKKCFWVFAGRTIETVEVIFHFNYKMIKCSKNCLVMSYEFIIIYPNLE